MKSKPLWILLNTSLTQIIFGFGAEISRKYPKEWTDLKDTWDDEFPKLNVEIDVETSLRRSGLTRRSIHAVRKEEG